MNLVSLYGDDWCMRRSIVDIIESLRYFDVVYIVAGCIRLISIGVIALVGLVFPS